MSDAAAIPHCDFPAFLLRPKISLLAIGTVSGFGMVIPDVSDSAVTSIAEGGAMFLYGS